MEVEVRRVPGMHDCFAALPLGMIEALQGGSNAPLFSITLELRLLHGKELCYLFWAGAASTSSSIEVSDKLAECIGLTAGDRVHVKALADIAHATTVVLEPATEDDWEILELNAGFVEDHILSQVGVLCSGQLFPVWVLGQNVLTLNVISTSPKRVVKLVPGTELIVAPKPRKYHSQMLSDTKVNVASSIHESFTVKAWLRVQEFDLSLAQPCALKEFSFYVLPTTAIFVSPETAQVIPFTDGQLVVVTCEDAERTKRKVEQERRQTLRAKAGVVRKDDTNSKLIVVRLVYCNLVSEGHVMIASSVRLFIGAEIHTRIEVASFTQTTSSLLPFVILSPTRFKTLERFSDDAVSNNYGQDVTVEGAPTLEVAAEKIYEDNTWEWEKHNELLTIAPHITDIDRDADKTSIDEGGEPHYVETHEVKCLFKIWAAAQFAAISKCTSGQNSTIPMPKEVVMQFLLSAEVKRLLKLSNIYSKKYGIEEFSLNNRNGWKKKPSEVLHFMLSLHTFNEHERHIDMNAKAYDSNRLTAYKGVFLFDQKILESESGQGLRRQLEDRHAGLFKMKLGQPSHIICALENDLEGKRSPSLSALAWLKAPASEALSRLQVLLSPEAQEKYHKLGLTFPGYVLIHGPPACGKTKLALALARELEEDPSILAHKILVKCAELAQEQAQAVQSALQDAVSEALRHSPSLIILDDLNMAIPSVPSSGDSEPSTTAVTLAEFLTDLLDSYQINGRNRYGAPIAFLAVAETVSSVPASLCSSGRFDFHVELPAPAAAERAAILHQELEQRSLTCQQHIIHEIASKCDGYNTSDLEVVVDRAVHVAAARFLSLPTHKSCMADNDHAYIQIQKLQSHVEERERNKQMILDMQKHKFELLQEDFTQALNEFLPVSMRDVKRAGGQVGRLGWEDVGGLKEICQTLQEMLELPVKYSKIFSNAPLRLRSGVLLYGPPGCGKTHVVGTAAAACSLRFISVKGPELLNKYIGASEQGVRDIFAKATAAAPCILFFDEFDAIAPKRGHDNTGVTDRVVNQLLTELDGVEALNGVFVFAATSRPDLLDAALLRPGRLDRLLFCDFPTATERLEILEVLSRKLSLGEDVNLNMVASLTENFSGADLQAVLSDAQLEAVNSFLIQSNCGEGIVSGKCEGPIITMAVLRSVLEKARPSVSQREKRRLYDIYKVFTSSRSSIGGKARDAKGKRVTLA